MTFQEFSMCELILYRKSRMKTLGQPSSRREVPVEE